MKKFLIIFSISLVLATSYVLKAGSAQLMGKSPGKKDLNCQKPVANDLAIPVDSSQERRIKRCQF